jgi:acetoacetate decarboxylase
MSGGAYNLMQVGIPVQFNGIKDRESGLFLLVVWENKTQPIIGGREQNGVPKVFADMQDIRMFDGKYFTNYTRTFLST